jgi:hypothetical protein
MKNFNKKGGISILGLLVLAVVILLVLSYFHISIRGVVDSPTGQDNINYVSGTTTNLWDEYLQKPASYFWNDIWVNIFWKTFVENMQDIRDKNPTILDKVGQNLQIPQPSTSTGSSGQTN